jgi:hypothetical protein
VTPPPCRRGLATGLAMRCGNDHSADFRDSRALLFGLVYPAICITCILVLARRIRCRQRRRYLLLGGQMDPPSEKSGGEQSPSATNAERSDPPPNPYDRAPLPSACDILQPLSRSSPLPPSGYLAAVLGQERRNQMAQAYQQESQDLQQPASSPYSGSDGSPSAAGRTDRRNSPSRIGSSPTQADDSSQATSPPSGRGAETDDQGLPSSPDSGSIKKRSQQVQFLHDVDDQGVRTWRRWVVEYC